MITVCVPSEEARAAIGPLPDRVRVLAWPADAAAPDGVADSEFLLGDYSAPPATAERLAQLPRLKVIQLLSAGVERWLPLVPDGVTLCNGRGVHGGATAELAVAGVLALTRRLPHFLAEQAAGRWAPERTDDLDGKRVLVLGAGDIGRRAAAALEVFGVRTTYLARSAREGVAAIDELPQRAREADILLVAVPLTDETEGLVDEAILAALPDGAILVNIARGPIVDTGALLAQLRAQRLRAVLDVTDPEPLPPGHPLWQAPGLVLTPHVGGGTHGWQRRGFRLVREQIERYATGQPLINVVGRRY